MNTNTDSLLIPAGMRSPCGRLRLVRICLMRTDGILVSPHRRTRWHGPVMRAASWSNSSAVSGESGLHGIWDRWPDAVPPSIHYALVRALGDGRAVVSATAARVERMSVQEIVLHPDASDEVLAAVRARYPEVPVRRARRSRARIVTLSPDGTVTVERDGPGPGLRVREERRTDGTVVIERWRDGRPHGRWSCRRRDYASVKHWLDGQPSGRWWTRRSDGTTIIERYRAGLPYGRWETRFADGTVTIEHWRDGQRVD